MVVVYSGGLQFGSDASLIALAPDLARRVLSAAERIAELEAALVEAQDALENLCIAISMGWDLEGVLDVARVALRNGK